MKIFRTIFQILRNSNCSKPGYSKVRRNRRIARYQQRYYPQTTYSSSYRDVGPDNGIHQYKAVCKYCNKQYFGWDTQATMLKAIGCEEHHETIARESVESLNIC